MQGLIERQDLFYHARQYTIRPRAGKREKASFTYSGAVRRLDRLDEKRGGGLVPAFLDKIEGIFYPFCRKAGGRIP
jgi:hypothetical protein